MDNEAPALSIARLRSVWDAEVGPSARRALTAAAFAGLFCAAHVAREYEILGEEVARRLRTHAPAGDPGWECALTAIRARIDQAKGHSLQALRMTRP